MNVQKKNKEKGFTIIEVVLVLAIAALIFLMVFIALPALQRSQRDTQRKQDLSRAMTAISSYQSNNRNAPPSNWDDFTTKYLRVNGDTFADPTGENYVFKPTTSAPNIGNFDSNQPFIYAVSKATCNGESVTTGLGANKIALQMKLEGGGIACESN
jgi:prepilin-type N-terminal cleavage/methylation domain-containing protein